MKKGTGEVCRTGGCKVCGAFWLVAGILFILKDIGTWTFWGWEPWTVFFLLVGLHLMCGCGRK